MLLYRADGRILKELQSTGFQGRSIMTLRRSRDYIKEYLGEGANKNITGHNWGKDPKLISTSIDKDCAGQTGGKANSKWRKLPIYQLNISNFKERDISLDTLGFTPKRFKAFSPVLYMNAQNLHQATMFGLRRRKAADEFTMFTNIDFKYFSGVASEGVMKQHISKKEDAYTGYTGAVIAAV